MSLKEEVKAKLEDMTARARTIFGGRKKFQYANWLRGELIRSMVREQKHRQHLVKLYKIVEETGAYPVNTMREVKQYLQEMGLI